MIFKSTTLMDLYFVIFQGGHHRYAIAKVTDVDVFPIYIEKHNKIEIDKRLFVNWKNA